MTGPERETLTALLHSLDAFRVEVKTDFHAVYERINHVSDEVQALKLGGARQEGVELAQERRGISTVRLLAMLASTATIAGVIVGIVIRFI